MFYLRWSAEEWPKPFHFASLIMVGGLTLFAFSSSFTLEIADRASLLPNSEASVRWMAISIVTWLTFLFLEVVEWTRLIFMERLDWTTTFGSTYLALMISHWLAVLVGVCWMTYVANDVKKRDVLATAMYTHFLNFIWLVLLFTLYMSNLTLDGI